MILTVFATLKAVKNFVAANYPVLHCSKQPSAVRTTFFFQLE